MATETWRTDLVEAFARFDADKSGSIDRREFSSLLESLGSTLSQDDREVGFKIIDEDQDGKITLAELSNWWEIVRTEGADPSVS